MRTRLIPAPLLALALIAAPVAFATSSCACGTSTVAATSNSSSGCDTSSSTQPCSPYAENANEFGKIGVQQAGKQKPVAWGVYPKNPAGVFTVTITVDGQVYDKKTQPYPPHGSSAYDAKNKRYLQSGGTFRIDGTIKRPNGGTEGFYFQCKLA